MSAESMNPATTNGSAPTVETRKDTTETQYVQPRKEILTKTQLEQFQASPTHAQILEFMTRLNESVVGVKLRDNCHESKVSPLNQNPDIPILVKSITL
jgi:hypothetical protein